jgi:trafficking protein particle complex subunit 3
MSMEGETTNAEVLALTYGAIVRQLLADLSDIESVNNQLKEMGNNIGTRLIEEFLARTGTTKCSDFQATARVIAEKAFPMFLGVRGIAKGAEADDASRDCVIHLREMPLAEFVEIPPQYQGLKFCNLIAGVIEGALGRVNLSVKCEIVKDMLCGAQEYEFSLKLLQDIPPEQYPFDEND